MTPKDFVNKYKAYALASQAKTGISAAFTLAQAALESGWGEKAPGFNFFGIRATKSTPENARQLITTTEYLMSGSADAKFPIVLSKSPTPSGKWKYVVKDYFRKYASPEEAFTDHGNLFIRNKRYSRALQFADNPHLFADEIAKAGYATAPNYASSLKSVIKTIQKLM